RCLPARCCHWRARRARRLCPVIGWHLEALVAAVNGLVPMCDVLVFTRRVLSPLVHRSFYNPSSGPWPGDPALGVLACLVPEHAWQAVRRWPERASVWCCRRVGGGAGSGMLGSTTAFRLQEDNDGLGLDVCSELLWRGDGGVDV